MSSDRFCSQCGTARQPQAVFCVQCGHQFTGGSRSWKMFAWLTAIVVVLAVVVYFGIRVLLPSTAAPGKPLNQAHDHSHSDDPRLQALQQSAAQGQPREVMQLVSYLLEKGVSDKHYLFEATQQLEALLKDYPQFAFGLRTLGNLYFDLQMPSEAEVIYRRYLTLHPLDANYRTDLGTVLLANGKSEEAIDQYKRAMAIFPDHYHAAFNLSIAYQKIKDSSQSEHYRNLAADIDSRVGKQLAPEIKVPDLPEGHATNPSPTNSDSGTGRYAQLEAFFRNHEIVGPKMTGFAVQDEIAVLSVKNFPMETMPQFARKAFDTKVVAQMGKVTGNAPGLEIRDSDTGAILAEYGPDSQP